MRMSKINRAVVFAAVSQQPQAKKQIRALANSVRNDARRLAPKDTGALRRSIKVWNYYDPATKTVSYRIGWDKSIAFYGPLVEFGNENAAAHPHLRPAADRHGGRPPVGGS